MQRQFTLEYWVDDGWYVGKLKEVPGIPGIFSQGESLDELEENIKDAYTLMMQEEHPVTRSETRTKDITVDVA
jgi:predicted RNase H-like HicB family nuclease